MVEERDAVDILLTAAFNRPLPPVIGMLTLFVLTTVWLSICLNYIDPVIHRTVSWLFDRCAFWQK